MSQPALKALTRIALQRVATPVPRTMSRVDGLQSALRDADARIEASWMLLWRDAKELGRLDWPAFAARVQALLLDLETTTELITALIPLCPGQESLPERARIVGERRLQVQRWLRQVGAK